ncbi:MAG: glycosyltransferase family 9 protein [Elusimicrobiota bacterium]|jgi:heptosyltransferase-2
MTTRMALIKLGALGDVVRTTSILRPLHHRYPGCEITWITLPSASPLLARNPWITRIVDREQDAAALEKESFEKIICLDEDRRAAALAARLKGEKFGTYLTDSNTVTYTPSSQAWFGMSLLNRDPDGSLQTANRLKQANRKTYPRILLEMLGLTDAPKEMTEPILIPHPEEEARAAEFLRRQEQPKSHPLLGINTGAGPRWINKQMTVEATARLVTALQKAGYRRGLLLGGPDEKERNAQLLQNTGTFLIDTGTDNSLARFISIVNLCEAVITSDSLCMHVALALQKKVIAFFGPTSPAEIDFNGRGAPWLPAHSCECYYLTKCRAPQFCLETLDPAACLQLLNQFVPIAQGAL